MAYTDIGDFAPGHVLTASDMDAIRANFRAIGDAWTNYTPTLTQSGSVTKTVTQAHYVRAGKLIIVNVRLDITGAGSAGNGITVTTPVAAKTSGLLVGNYLFYDASSGGGGAVGPVRLLTTGTFDFSNSGATSHGASPSFAVASGDVLQFQATYEAA